VQPTEAEHDHSQRADTVARLEAELERIVPSIEVQRQLLGFAATSN